MKKIFFIMLFFSLSANAEVIYLDTSSAHALDHSYSEANSSNDLIEVGFQGYRCLNAVVKGEEVTVEELSHAESSMTILRDANSLLSLRFENSGKVFELTPISSDELSSQPSELQFKLKILENDILLMRIEYSKKLMAILECTKSLLF